ncbi:MAG TPA: AAA family ATPase [Bacillales bacterium]|nr:AAA family ATPase [Bacillales bacterium]
MKKLRLIIADRDASFLELVSAYVFSSEQAPKFELKLFSDQTQFREYVQDGRKYDILLASSEWIPSHLPEPSGMCMILEDDRVTAPESAEPSVFKFQPLNQLMSSILSVYNASRGSVQKLGDSTAQTKRVAVFSASGGTGKTTVAVNLCKQFALQNKRVFYLNLELLHSTPLFFSPPPERTSTQILYYLKTDPDQLSAKIESLKYYDPHSTISSFNLPVNPHEMADLTGEETEALVSALMVAGNYDIIVIDCESSLEERIKTALRISDEIIWLVNNDTLSFHKTCCLEPALEEFLNTDKITRVLNKYTGQAAAEHSQSYDLHLPYIPEWKNAKDGRTLMSSPVFADALLSLTERRGVLYGE